MLLHQQGAAEHQTIPALSERRRNINYWARSDNNLGLSVSKLEEK